MAGPAISHAGRKHTLPAGRASRGPADEGAAAQRPRLGGGHAGAAAHQKRGNHDPAICPVHFFVVPGGASAGEALVNCPRTTSITGVPTLPGLSW